MITRLYPYKARTSNKVVPDLVDYGIYGHHRSMRVGQERFWAFEEEAGRNLFLIAVENGTFLPGKRVKP